MNMLRRSLLAATLMLTTAAFADKVVTADALFAKAKDFDGKVVSATGKVAEYSEKTSKKGNLYITFKLKGAKETVSVYLRGRLQKPPKVGDAVIVTGMFKKEKKVGTQTFTNEIDASAEKGKPDNVKPIKTK